MHGKLYKEMNKNTKRILWEAYKTSIVPISDLRMNHLKEMRNYTTQEMVGQENLDSNAIQFYVIEHNSQSNH
jgi:hypothetical protein